MAIASSPTIAEAIDDLEIGGLPNVSIASPGRPMAASREVMSAAGEKMARSVASRFDEQDATITAAIERAKDVNDADVVARNAELYTQRDVVDAMTVHLKGSPMRRGGTSRTVERGPTLIGGTRESYGRAQSAAQ